MGEEAARTHAREVALPVSGQPMTLEQAALLDPDKFPGEIVDGRWVPVTGSTWRHGEVAGNVCALLRAYARARTGWSVAVGDPGTKLASDRMRGPDVAIVSSDRRPTGKGVAGWLDGAPDVAVEIVGDSQSVTELLAKALEFIAAGAKMVWIADAETRQVALITPPGLVRILEADDTLDGGEALPGFACRVAEFFE